MRQFGLIGYPLGHSFSKKYFSEKFEREGISGCSYELFPIESIQELPQLLAEHPQLEGLNVTIPYKKEVIPFLDEMNGLPASLQACNCIRIHQGKLSGYNTDIVGFEKSFCSHLQSWHTHALVLGAGGAAAAVRYVLDKLGIDFKTVGRKAGEGIDVLYSDLNASDIEAFPVIINTTPLGTYPNTDECPQLPYEVISSKHYLFDLVYNPARTLFLQKGLEKGATIENGYDMLVFQAEEAWRIWNEPL